jgi:putative drug exporter of the RND superfamily
VSVALYRLARWCYQRRVLVVVVWLVAAAGIVTLAQAFGGKTTDSLTIPGTESQRMAALLEKKLPAAAGASTQVVFAVKSGEMTDAGYRQAVEEAVAELGTVPRVAGVDDPFKDKSIAPDGKVALATVHYTVAAGEVEASTLDKLGPAVAAARSAGVEVEFSGGVYPGRSSGASSAELIGIGVALVILIVTLGSFLAAGMPILTALLGVIISLMGMTALAAVADIASAATTVGAMLGISCGIDYALFILSRHRNYILQGHEPEEAAGRAAGTAGSSVVFAGLSVVIALCGLVVVGIPFLAVMGLAAAGAIVIGLLVALTLLPAVLGFAGARVARFSRLPLLRRARPATQTAVERPGDLTGTRWAAWVTRHRVPVLITGVIMLGVMAIPVTTMDLGLPGASSRPTSDTSRRAYDLTTAHFGAGYNGALTVVAEDVTSQAQANQLATALGNVDGVASASARILTNGIAVIGVVPTTGPNDQATKNLVHRLRNDRAAIEGTTGTTVLVGGKTAADIDVSAKLGSALPVFLIVVAGLAFLLLTFAFSTILIPIKSIIGFLLSMGAALGAEVAVFQWGWLSGLLGTDKTQTLSFLPVILIAIIFGLSSDYEVFVVSRIKEHYTTTGDARQAIITGTGQSARVVTAAALIMTSVFAAFLLTNDPIIKAIGFSFALGVLLDAFVVRLTLVPAVMAIIGAKIWHHPAWYGRYVPDPDIEGKHLDQRLHVTDNLDEQPATV